MDLTRAGARRAHSSAIGTERIADNMRAVFTLRGKETQGEMGKFRNAVAVLLRLIAQAMAEHVEGVDAVPGRKCGDIFLPFQHRAADSRQKNDGRARATRLPVAGAERADIDVSVLTHAGESFARVGDDHTHRPLSFFP